ncbi:MAG: sigma factor-like helix-turn-helix DNA-binding protein [Terriglobales bacterium]
MSTLAPQRGRPLPTVVNEAQLPLYRARTLAMLRRYFVLALETGRLPSLLGREFFRTRVTSYKVHSFEDTVIFVHDMERCLERLQPLGREVIARRVLQGHTEEEVADQLQITRRHVVRVLPEALDELSAVLLNAGLLDATADARALRKPGARILACQAPQTVEISASA